MKFIDALVGRLSVLLLGFLGVFLILLPFEQNGLLNTRDLYTLLDSTRGNYIYLVVGILLLLLSIVTLLSGILFKSDKKSYVLTPMNFGDLKISDEAIEGLTQNVISRIVGIRGTKIVVRFKEDIVSIDIRGQVSPDVNIPTVVKEIQDSVKDTVESHTGIMVNQVNVDVLSIASPIKSLK